MAGMDENWFLGISPNAFGVVGAIVNFAVAFTVMRFTDEAPAEIQAMVDRFRSPQSEQLASADH